MIETEEFLVKHYGTRGMHWGVRTKSTKTPEEKKARNKKVAIRVGLAGGAAIGAVLLARHGKVAMKHIAQRQQNAEAVKNLIEKNKNVRVSMNKEHRAFVADYIQRQQRINSAANQSLRSIYREAETPIRRRGYLPDWK